MAKLFGGLGSAVEELMSGVGDGIQKAADKAESLTSRINRHVNPLSSHYGETKDQRGSKDPKPGDRRGSDHHERHNSDPMVNMPAVGLGNATPPFLRGGIRQHSQSSGDLLQPVHDTFNWHANKSQSSGDLLRRGSGPAPTDFSIGLSRSACDVTSTILSAVENEILDLQKEKEQYHAALAAVRKLEAEQDEEYVKLEEMLKSREAYLRSAISEAEAQSSVTTVQF